MMIEAPKDPLAFTFGLDFKRAGDRIDDEASERQRLAIRVAPYHVDFLDDVTRGIMPHDLVLLGADTGVGKTDIVTTIAQRNAIDRRPVFLFALEAEPREIERRIKYRLVAQWAYERGYECRHALTYVDWYLGRFASHVAKLETEADAYIRRELANLRTYYRGKDFGREDIHRLCLAIQTEASGGMIIIDHLHYVDIDDAKHENAEYKRLVQTIRDVVLSTGVPVIVVVHLRKGDGFREPLVPHVERIHGSSEIAKIATTSIMLARAPFPGRDPSLSATFVTVGKSRIAGQCPLVALTNYDIRTRTYQPGYTLGRLENRGMDWTEIHPDTRPPWAKRFRSSGVELSTIPPTKGRR